MQVKTSVKAGGWTLNHNATPAPRLVVRTGIKAGPGGFGGLSLNHNETPARRVAR